MSKIRVAFIIHLLWSVAVLASLTNIYNTATPGSGDDPRNADDEMRLIKAAIQERMNDHNGTADEGDHYWPLSVTQVSNVDTGQHRMLTLRQMSDNPSTLTSYASITDLGFLYLKDVSGNGELYWQDEAANVLQLTTNGLFNLNSAIWAGVFATSTSDGSDNKNVILTAGGTHGVGRGAGIVLYGNEYGSGLSGQLVLQAGYSAGTTKAIINASSSLISNVVNPVSAQDAATKAYVDAEFTERATQIASAWGYYAGGESGDQLTDGYNVVSATWNAGWVDVVFTSALANANYAVMVTPDTGVDVRGGWVVGTRQTTGFKIQIRDHNGAVVSPAVSFVVLGGN